jgi:hypothetical protein
MRFTRPRPHYANVAATLALLLAMGGGALAATHYLITSTSQISPRVLSQLRGRRGPGGPVGRTGKTGRTGRTGKSGAPGKPGGPRGKTGRTGKTGKEGPPGPSGLVGVQGVVGPPGGKGQRGERGEPGPGALAPLKSGETESGLYGTSAPAAAPPERLFEAVTLPVALADRIPIEKVEYVPAETKEKHEHCEKRGSADRGYLCLYSNYVEGPEILKKPILLNIEAEKPEEGEGSGPRGFVLEWFKPVAGTYDIGTYAITAK